MVKEKKHAYLILAYNELDMLKLLIKSIDDTRNDIYVHMDAKTVNFNPGDFENITSYSTLTFVKRIKVFWASFSLVQAYLLLMKEASMKMQYQYYHIISGVDIPLMTQNEIHQSINSAETDNEFIQLSSISMQELKKNIKKSNTGFIQKFLFLFRYEPSKFGSLYFLNRKHFSLSKTGFYHKMISTLGRISIVIQQLLQIENNKNLPIFYGSNWYSITHELVKNILIHEKWIIKHFKYCLAPDEIFLQTTIKNFNLPVMISPSGNRRYIDWKRGHPYTFRNENYDELINSNCFFARKFSTSVDQEIVKRLYYRLLPMEEVDRILT